MSIPKDVAKDNILPTSRIFITSNGPDRQTPDASDLGEVIPLVPTFIDAHNNFARLTEQVEHTLNSFTEEDYLLMGTSSIVLTLALTHLFFTAVPIRILDYDFLRRAFRVYTLNDTGQWTTTLPTTQRHLS